MAAENVPENRDTGLRLSFGNTIPAGFSVEPDLHIDNFLWGSAVRRQAPERLYIEHELSYRSLHQIRDFLVACYNALPVGGVLRIAETDFANPGSAYQAFIQGLNLRTPLDVGRLSALMAGAGFVVRGVEFHDGFGNFHGFRNELERNGFPARSRYKDGRGFDPEILYSSLVVDGYKQEAGPSPAFADAHLKFIALGDSHTRFLGGKDDIEDGENVPHTRQYKGFAAHFRCVSPRAGACL
jgi:predicted SAM-dependent methyltransferase